VSEYWIPPDEDWVRAQARIAMIGYEPPEITPEMIGVYCNGPRPDPKDMVMNPHYITPEQFGYKEKEMSKQKIRVRVMYHLADPVLMGTHDSLAREYSYETEIDTEAATHSRFNPMEFEARNRVAVHLEDQRDEHGNAPWVEIDQIAYQYPEEGLMDRWYYVTLMNLRDLITMYQQQYLEATVTPNTW
jgi:hypothetical protein